MKKRGAGGQRKLLLVAILLACFLGVDRFLVQASAGAHARASTAFHAAEDELLRARGEAERLKSMEAALGRKAGEASGPQASSAITFLNGLLSRRALQKVDLRALTRASGGEGEPYQLTVRGAFSNFVLFLGDLESFRETIRLRDMRISRGVEGTGLEMQMRLEIEGPQR